MDEVTNVETATSLWQISEYIILFIVFAAQAYVCYMVVSKTRQIGKFLPESRANSLQLEKELTPEAKERKDREEAERRRKEREMQLLNKD